MSDQHDALWTAHTAARRLTSTIFQLKLRSQAGHALRNCDMDKMTRERHDLEQALKVIPESFASVPLRHPGG
jgi:hypothetical protein